MILIILKTHLKIRKVRMYVFCAYCFSPCNFYEGEEGSIRRSSHAEESVKTGFSRKYAKSLRIS